MKVKIRLKLQSMAATFNECNKVGLFFVLKSNDHVCSTLNDMGDKDNVFDWTKNCVITVKNEAKVEYKDFELVEV